MRRIGSIISISFAFVLAVAVAVNAQTTEFNHKTGKFLEVDGANIYYEEIENAGKPILLFLHGGSGDIQGFNSIVPLFTNDYHIIGIDSRGHGKSALGTGKLTYKRLQLDVEAVANHLKLQDINIIGYSDGGVVAYRLAAANRIPIRKIVTIGAGWSLSDVEVNEKLLADMTPEKFKSWFRRDYDEFAKSLLAMWTDKTEDGYPLASIETISVPTLIIRGNDDAWFPFESAVEFTTKVQKSLLFNIPFAPHAAFRKYPHFFEVITKEFLNGK